MWQNGFSIDDGPLRAYNDQQNKEFLNDVMMGRIPRELVREARGGEVMVNMEDHKDQPYEAPKVMVILIYINDENLSRLENLEIFGGPKNLVKINFTEFFGRYFPYYEIFFRENLNKISSKIFSMDELLLL